MSGVAASPEVELVANWILRTNHAAERRPFIIGDKRESMLFAFDAAGRLLGKTPALFGAVRSDALTEAQANKDLDDVLDEDKITPAGLFHAEGYHSPSYGDTVRFASYARTNLLIHRGFDAERIGRLKSPAIDDNRITYGCINALPEFVDRILLPNFSGKSIVVILPETQTAAAYFGIREPVFAGIATLSPHALLRRVSAFLRGVRADNGENVLHSPSGKRNRPPEKSVTREILFNGKKRVA